MLAGKMATSIAMINHAAIGLVLSGINKMPKTISIAPLI